MKNMGTSRDSECIQTHTELLSALYKPLESVGQCRYDICRLSRAIKAKTHSIIVSEDILLS